MIDLDGRPHGNCKYTGTEYDALSGYVTSTYTMEWQDKDGTRWRKTCTVINLGKPDRVAPVASDAAMQAESLPSALLNASPKRRGGHGEIMGRIVEMLRRNGPMTTTDIGTVVNRSQQAIRNSMVRRTDLFVCLSGGGESRRPTTWGLVGVHDAEAA